MAHYNLYESIGLDPSKGTAALAAEIDQRIRSGNTWNPGGMEELQVARAVLGDASRRAAYDRKLADPLASDITVDSLRRLADVNFDANPAAPAYAVSTKSYQDSPVAHEPAQEAKKRPVWPWVAGVAVALALASGVWFWQSQGTEWDAAHAQVAQDFPQLVADADGGRGYDGMTCTSREIEGNEEAKIRCQNSDLGVNIYRYESAEQRDSVLPGDNRELYGNDACQFVAVEVPDQSYPTYYIAPDGEWDHYLLLLNGDAAAEEKTRLPIC